MKRFGVLVLACLMWAAGCWLPVRAQEGRRLAYGDSVQATITARESRHAFYFEGRQGDVVTARLTPTSGNLDPLLLLVDNNGDVLAISDDVDETLGAAITTIGISEDNFYFVIATRFGHSLGVTEGGFTLSLEREGVLSEAGGYLNYGDSVIGFIDDNMPRLTYVFEAERGDIVNVRMQRVAGSNLDSYVYIASEDGQILVDNDDREGSLDAAISSFLILEPGFYQVVASRFGQEAGTTEGSFVLTLDTTPVSGQGISPEAALLLRYGAEASNSIGGEVPGRFYTFGAQRGDIISAALTRTSGNLDPYLVLLNGRREILQEDDDSGPSNNALIEGFIIPETGTYYLYAGRFEGDVGTTTGEFTLRLDGATGEAPVVAPGTLTILYGSTVSGQIDDDQASVTYAFLADAGDIITISLTRTEGNLDPLLLLFSADSVQLAQDDDAGPDNDARIATFEVPDDGIYYIIATRYQFQDGTTAGRYSLSLVRQDSGTAAES